MANNVDYSSIYDIVTLQCGIIRVQNENFAHQLQQKMSKHGNHYLPETILTYRNIHSFDVLENQMLKHFLTMIYTCCTALNKWIDNDIQNLKLDKELNQTKKSNYENMQRQCADFKRRVVFMKNQPFLEDVQELTTFDYSSSVLRREMNYMRFYEIYKKFREHPIFDLSDVYRLSIKDMPTLYEYYCALVITSILLEYKDWNPEEHMTKQKEIGYSMRLNTGDECLIKLSKDGKHIRFFYNKQYDKYSEGKVRPDFAIEMTAGSKIRILILDAKYRNELKPESDNPESAINKMHVYKDSIRENGKHLVESAFVLYLGDTKIQSINSEECTNECIGGIKILPIKNGVDGNIECLREEIKKFINAV
ncbi:MAG: restriction endonuclease-like protein [Desulfobacula sp.]|nr:restriction endonuclease-like protein [Desulfobacula sp.]